MFKCRSDRHTTLLPGVYLSTGCPATCPSLPTFCPASSIPVCYLSLCLFYTIPPYPAWLLLNQPRCFSAPLCAQ
ncbi:hypothetical protein AVEN_228324-1, partial [Araneus ventricosus]